MNIMSNPTKIKSEKPLDLNTINNLNRMSIRKRESIEFAGFLTRDDEDAVYVADMLGTWVIPKKDIVSMVDWNVKTGNGNCPPDTMIEIGKPVRIGIKEGAIISEIRPWQIKKVAGGMGDSQFRQGFERIFTLGGGKLPIGENTLLSESMMAKLERMFARRLGWNPDDPCTDPHAFSKTCSKTIEVEDGFTDYDESF